MALSSWMDLRSSDISLNDLQKKERRGEKPTAFLYPESLYFLVYIMICFTYSIIVINNVEASYLYIDKFVSNLVVFI